MNVQARTAFFLWSLVLEITHAWGQDIETSQFFRYCF